MLFLDTDSDANAQQDREISFYLYGGSERYRLKQEAILGFGGVRMLDALGFKVRKYHMNEGHSSLLAVELMRKHGWMWRRCVSFAFYHAYASGGRADKFNYDLVAEVLQTLDLSTLKKYGGEERST